MHRAAECAAARHPDMVPRGAHRPMVARIRGAPQALPVAESGSPGPSIRAHGAPVAAERGWGSTRTLDERISRERVVSRPIVRKDTGPARLERLAARTAWWTVSLHMTKWSNTSWE